MTESLSSELILKKAFVAAVADPQHLAKISLTGQELHV
jgi:hypothetical protein